MAKIFSLFDRGDLRGVEDPEKKCESHLSKLVDK